MKKILLSLILFLFLFVGTKIIINDETPLAIHVNEKNFVKMPEITKEESLKKEEQESIEIDYVEVAINETQEKIQAIDDIEDKQQWFIEYKAIIEEYKDSVDPPETVYDYFSEEELDFLFKVVQAEIGDEYSFEQKANVANVIFNRVESSRFPNNIMEILIQNQFHVIKNGRYKSVNVSEITILACEYAFMFGELDKDILFFDSNDFLSYEKAFNDGAHTFYRLREE